MPEAKTFETNGKSNILMVDIDDDNMLNDIIEWNLNHVKFSCVRSDTNGSEAQFDHILGIMDESDMIIIFASVDDGSGMVTALAQAAKSHGALTVVIVTAQLRCRQESIYLTDERITALNSVADSVIVIPKKTLETTTRKEYLGMQQPSFRNIQDELFQAIRAICDLIIQTGYMRVGFDDIKWVMAQSRSGVMVSSGFATGKNRAILAAERTMASPMLANINIQSSMRVLLIVSGNEDMTIAEIDCAVTAIHAKVDEGTSLTYNIVYDQESTGVRVTVVASDFSGKGLDNSPAEQ